MSYDIRIRFNDEIAVAPDGEEVPMGGTYSPGMRSLEFNITYNYWKYFRECIDEEEGIRWIYGKKVSDTLPKLYEARDVLFQMAKSEPLPDDYWTGCALNSAKAIDGLIKLGELCPDGEWEGD